MHEIIDVDFEITDEQGKPVPYVTIWGYVLPRSNPLAIDAEDLWRVTSRYQSSHEQALPVFHQQPVPYLQIYPMANALGRAALVIDYQFLEGAGSRRPDSMQIGFTFMKRGYLPSRIDFRLGRESRVTSQVVLKRDSHQALGSPPYLEEFDRVRYALSKVRPDLDNSQHASEHNENLRMSLDTAAQQAIAAGDNRSAARIYARMQYLPSAQTYDGHVIGFAQAEPDSEQSRSYLLKAYQLDPNNPNIAARYLFQRGADEFGGTLFSPEKASDERKKAFAEFMVQMHALMRAHGEQVWPIYHRLYAKWHRKSSDLQERARMIPLLDALYKFEPKLATKADLMRVPSW